MNHKKSTYKCTTCTRKLKDKDGKYILCAMHGNVRKRKECKDSAIAVKPNRIKYDALSWTGVQ